LEFVERLNFLEVSDFSIGKIPSVETKIISKLFHFCGESPQKPFNNSFGGFRRPEFGGKSRGSNNNDSLVLEPPAQVCDGGSISHNVTHDKHPGSCFHFSIKHRLAKSE
jgi:hypothetical protein